MSLDLNIGSTVSLLVASLDLKLVELLRDAIRTADLSAAASAGNAGGLAAPTPLPREHVTLPAVIEPRAHYHPEPYFEPRTLYYTATTCRGTRMAAPVVEVVAEGTAGKPPECELPFQPPWKVLPWQNPPPVILKMKPIVHRPDQTIKGRTIDLFI